MGFQQGSRSRAAALAVTAAAVAVDVVHVPDSRAMLAVAALYNGEVGLIRSCSLTGTCPGRAGRVAG